MGTGRRFDVTVGLGVATARVVVGVVAVVVVASAGAAESDDVELHALPNNSATTMAPVIDESLRITELNVPLKPISQYGREVCPTFACRERRATRMVGLGLDSLRPTGTLGSAVFVINLATALIVPTVAWPGSAVDIVDQTDALGGNISGLTFAGPSSLWAVRDGPSTLSKLDRTTAGWAATSGSGGARNLHYADGSGAPDAEAVTTAAGDDAVVYVAAERDSNEPSTSRNSILRFDASDAGGLRATQQWELNAVLPPAGANTGIEGLAWIPDDVFVSMGFRDATGKPYAPADYPRHGKGLFVVGLEANGTLYVVALRDDGGVALVASMPSGLTAVMEVVWSTARQELWALCDNTCDGSTAVLRPSAGSFVLALIVEPPPGMATLNNEGFALGSSCADGTMAAIWADDGASAGHVLREATLSCAAIASTGTAPVTQPATEGGSIKDPPREEGSFAVFVAVGFALAIAAAFAFVVVRRARSRHGH